MEKFLPYGKIDVPHNWMEPARPDPWFTKIQPRFKTVHQSELSRFAGLLNFNLLNQRVLVVGCGAVGRQAILQLTSMGIPTTIVDFDRVDKENVGSQGFMVSDVGKYKADAVADEANFIYGSQWELCSRHVCKIEDYPGEWPPYILCMVDSMEVRKWCIEKAQDCSAAFIDTRMGALFMKIFCVQNFAQYRRYLDGWYPSSEAYQATCTTKTTIFCAYQCSAVAVGYLARILAGRPILSYSWAYDINTEEVDIEP